LLQILTINKPLLSKLLPSNLTLLQKCANSLLSQLHQFRSFFGGDDVWNHAVSLSKIFIVQL